MSFCFLQYTALPTCCNCRLFFLITVCVGSGLPPLLWNFPHDSCCYKLSLLQGCWAGAAASAFSGQLVYLRFAWRVALPTLQSWGAPPSFFFFLSCLFIIQFVFFSFFSPWVGGRSIQGAMLICPRVVCGSTVCCLAHLLVCFSQAG
jgi:hypothetical protein